ncbi:MAG: hypothetical protein LCH91_02650 [Bacteroidetes bacterium]|nr:hypothetical protein [Bacteroidota bacterium]
MKNRSLVYLVWVMVSLNALAQTDIPTLNADKPLEFTIPTSAAFDLLGVTPAQVTKPGNIRDFKVDWSFASWRLKPNIAIQAQPVWELLYNRPKLQKYQAASKLMKTLSTLDISAGTIEDENLTRRLAVATKITLFRSHDALDEPDLFKNATQRFEQQQKSLLDMRRDLEDSLRKTPNQSLYLENRTLFLQQLQGIEAQLIALEKGQKEVITALANTYLKEHWNASFLDIAVGRSYNYFKDQLDSLQLQRDGLSVWVNGCVGLGRKWLITGVFRYTTVSTPLRPSTREFFGGINFRYGSPKFNFFVEALNRDEANLFRFKAVTIAYGGDWRFSKNVMLSYGVRTVYGTNFSFKQLVPIASIACMMR